MPLATDPPPEHLQRIRDDRVRALADILASTAPKKLIIAGPGTGKTHTFRAALERTGQRGLALTFIRLLVKDLETKLADVADVFTFHVRLEFEGRSTTARAIVLQ